MHKFPSIEQFRHVIRHERDVASYQGAEPAKRTYVGTVKLHGTNAGITLQHGKLIYLSRNRTLALDDDNAGFVAAITPYEDPLFGAF